MNDTKAEYEQISVEEVQAGMNLHGEIVHDEAFYREKDIYRSSILINGKMLTVETFQELLNTFEGYEISLVITDPTAQPASGVIIFP